MSPAWMLRAEGVLYGLDRGKHLLVFARVYWRVASAVIVCCYRLCAEDQFGNVAVKGMILADLFYYHVLTYIISLQP